MIEIDGLTKRYGDKMTGLPSDQRPQNTDKSATPRSEARNLFTLALVPSS